MLILNEGGVVLSIPDARALAAAVLAAHDYMKIHGASAPAATLRLAAAISAVDGTTEDLTPAIEDAYIHEHITTKQAAGILGCSERYIRDLAVKGRLPGRKTGNSWIFTRDDVQVFRDFRD